MARQAAQQILDGYGSSRCQPTDSDAARWAVYAEAVRQGEDAIATWLDTARAWGDPIPPPGVPPSSRCSLTDGRRHPHPIHQIWRRRRVYCPPCLWS
jgi:hypothetical protein